VIQPVQLAQVALEPEALVVTIHDLLVLAVATTVRRVRAVVTIRS